VTASKAQTDPVGVEETSTGAPERADRTPEQVETVPGPAAGLDGFVGRRVRPLTHGPFVVGFLLTLGGLSAYGIWQSFADAGEILMLIFMALFFAVGLHPAVVRLRRWGLPHGLAVTVVIVGGLLVAGATLFALVPPLVDQVDVFVRDLPGYLDALGRNRMLGDLDRQYDILGRLKAAATPETLGTALGGIMGGAELVFGTAFSVLTVSVLTVYFLAAFDKIKGLAYGLVPASRRDRVRSISDEILSKVGAYMVGALVIALVAGVAALVFVMIVGLAAPFALAVVIAVFDMIPQVGATLGAVVVSAVGFATSTSAGIACVVFFVIYQKVENYVIYPMVMRRSVNVSDAAAIVAALLGVTLLGVVGALIAIPAAAAIQLILREVVFPRQNRH
jgi:predicted PurR-regulated permease PerM